MPPRPVMLTARRVPEPGMPSPEDEMVPSTTPLCPSPPFKHDFPNLVASLSHDKHSMPMQATVRADEYLCV
jgi:hypothetical protein